MILFRCLVSLVRRAWRKKTGRTSQSCARQAAILCVNRLPSECTWTCATLHLRNLSANWKRSSPSLLRFGSQVLCRCRRRDWGAYPRVEPWALCFVLSRCRRLRPASRPSPRLGAWESAPLSGGADCWEPALNHRIYKCIGYIGYIRWLPAVALAAGIQATGSWARQV